MKQTQKNIRTKTAVRKQDAVVAGKEKISSAIFKMILKYRESKIFQWVNRNYILSMIILSLWGILIIGLFLWFLISNLVKMQA